MNVEFPSNSSEKIGRFDGLADTIGHTLTYKVLSDERKVVYQDVLESATHADVKNKIFKACGQWNLSKLKFDRHR